MKSSMLVLMMGFGIGLMPHGALARDGTVTHTSIGPSCCVPHGSGQACTACSSPRAGCDTTSPGDMCTVGGVQGSINLGRGAADSARIRTQIEGTTQGRYCVAEFVTGQLNSVACGTTHPVHGEVVCTGSTCTVGGIEGDLTDRPLATIAPARPAPALQQP